MDIDNLVSKTLDEVTINISKGFYESGSLGGLDQKQADEVELIKLLMIYSKTLLANYHVELKKELAEHNINL